MTYDGKPHILWSPWPGKQTMFCRASEFELLFGGAKGPGKSDCILMVATAQTHKPAYKALILRETFKELRELIDRSHRIFPRLAGRPAWNGDDHRWMWPSGASLTFGYYGGVGDLSAHQGKEWAYIGFDELGNLAEERAWELLISEVRCPDPTVRTMMRASANPGGKGHHWLKRRFVIPCGKEGQTVVKDRVKLESGQVVTLTRRYIPARVTDNPVYANDPVYMAQLQRLPEVIRRQLLHGDWDAGYGQALDELTPHVHLVDPFVVPQHYRHFAGFDWGFAHNWCFVWFCADEDGRLTVVDTIRGRRHLPHEIAERVVSRAPAHQMEYISSDSLPFHETRARGEYGPTPAETMAKHGIILSQGNSARKHRLNNLREWLSWRGRGLGGADTDPMLRFMDTEANAWLFDQLQSMVVDPDDIEDVLKVHADPVTGEGGDDGYDACSIGVASRPPRARSGFLDQPVSAFSRTTLEFERDWKYRDRAPPESKSRERIFLPTHPEFGDEL